jgi:glycine/D-amino acid oxidase-like deaminating enzyme
MAETPPPVSLWETTAQPFESPPALGEDLVAEVAIVGGGFTGLSTALHLGELGVEAVVVEAQRIGYGGSGRNAGLVNPGVWLSPDAVVDALGEERGERLNEGFRVGPALVFDLIKRHGIECEAVMSGTIYLASSEKMLTNIHGRAAQMNRRGARVNTLDREETAAKLGVGGFLGSIHDTQAGTINPMGYVRGLARAALKAGARIYCDSPATSLERDGEGWRVRTPHGSVRARRVLLATNGYTDDLWPGLKQAIYPFYFSLFATKPLGENLRNSLLPERQGAWDSEEPTIAFRLDAHGRLITGTIGSLPETGQSFRHRWADKMMRKHLPHLGEPEWETSWMGRIAFTTDHLPRVHELAPELFTIIGYNGRGIAPGTVMGRAMAHHLADSAEIELPVPLTPHKPIPFGRLRSLYYDFGAGVLQRLQMLRN